MLSDRSTTATDDPWNASALMAVMSQPESVNVPVTFKPVNACGTSSPSGPVMVTVVADTPRNAKPSRPPADCTRMLLKPDIPANVSAAMMPMPDIGAARDSLTVVAVSPENVLAGGPSRTDRLT